MELIPILCAAILIVAALIITIAYICFRMAFYVRDCDKKSKEEFAIPEGEIYKPWREKMITWIKETRALNCEQFSVNSYDGLTLCGKYYEQTPGAPIELMLHGYRGYAERDLCGGVQRAFALGHNALIVDMRACGESGGNVITFGIKEHRDCLTWVGFMVDHFGPDVKIILTGISMGASTVLNAAGCPLPDNVIGVLADCGFTSPKAIIQKVIKDMELPPKLAYPFVQLGAKLFGGFNIDAIASIDSVKRCKLPVIFFHGENDNFVPAKMSQENYEACRSRKRLVLVPGAEHGLSYPVAPKTYIQEAYNFFHGK